LIVHQRFTGDRLVGVWRFGLGFFYIDFALVYLGYGDLFDQLLGHAFVFEGDEAKSATFACIDVFENDGILDLTKILLKVIFQLLTSQIEIQPADKYLTFWVRIRNHVLVLGGFAVDLDVGVGFVEVVEVGREGGVGGEVGREWGSGEGLLLLVLGEGWGEAGVAAGVWAFGFALVIISRLDINPLVQNIMALALIYPKNLIFTRYCLLFVFERDEDESKAAAALRGTIAHDDRVDDFADGGEVVMQVLFCCGEGQSSHKELDLVLSGRLVE